MCTKMLMLALLTSACDSEGQVLSPEDRRATALPTVRKDGKDYPYIQYPEVTEKTESRGQAFFTHPMADERNRLLALEYTPGMKMENLFAEDMIGASGLVVQNGHQIRVEFLPISVPIGIAAGQEWRIRYAKREFDCKSGSPPPSARNSRADQDIVHKWKLYIEFSISP